MPEILYSEQNFCKNAKINTEEGFIAFLGIFVILHYMHILATGLWK